MLLLEIFIAQKKNLYSQTLSLNFDLPRCTMVALIHESHIISYRIMRWDEHIVLSQISKNGWTVERWQPKPVIKMVQSMTLLVSASCCHLCCPVFESNSQTSNFTSGPVWMYTKILIIPIKIKVHQIFDTPFFHLCSCRSFYHCLERLGTCWSLCIL